MNRRTVRIAVCLCGMMMAGVALVGSGAAYGLVAPMMPCCPHGNQPDYPIYINETGLPTGMTWWVNYGGYNLSTNTTSQIALSEPNGSYTYTAGTSSGYLAWPQSALSIIHGKTASILIRFASGTYEITFKQSTLPSGTAWGIVLDGGALVVSTATNLMIPAANGNHTFTVYPPRSYNALLVYNATPSSGKITVNGAPVAGPTIAFNSLIWSFTLTETGLAKGTQWDAYLNNSTTSTFEVASAPNSIVFQGLYNGTYSYTVLPVSGYLLSGGSGQIGINGANQKFAVKFTT